MKNRCMGVIALAVAAFAVGCEGDDGSGPAATAEPDATRTTDATMEPEADATTAGDAMAAADAAADASPRSPDAGPSPDMAPLDAAPMDAAPGPDAIPEGRVPAPEGTVALIPDPEDGLESGATAVGADGVAHFYSPTHEALVEFALAPGDDEPGDAAGVEIYIEVTAERQARVLVADPEGRYVPMIFGAELPDAPGDTLHVEVDGRDLLEGDEPAYRYAPGEPSPFMPNAFTIPEVLVVVSVQGLLRSIKYAAAVYVVKRVVEAGCNVLNPLHGDTCARAARWVEIAGTVLTPGIQMLRDGAWALTANLGVATGQAAFNYFAGWACGEVGTFFKWADPTAADFPAVRDRVRDAVRKLNHLLVALEEDPPADPEALGALLDAVGPALAIVAREVRENHVNVLQPPQVDDIAEGALSALVGTTLVSMTNGDIYAAWFHPNPAVRQMLVQPAGGAAVRFVQLGSRYTGGKIWVLDPRLLKSLQTAAGGALSCVVGLVTSFDVEVEGMPYTVETLEVIDAIADLAHHWLDHAYATHYGMVFDPPACLPDEFEPNGDRVAAQLGGAQLQIDGPVQLDGLNLCDGEGPAGDEDWFVFDMGPISLRAQARVRAPDPPGAGADERVCVEIFFYSELLELVGAEPERVEGPVCGRVGDAFSTQQFSVRRTVGEQWSQLIVRVYVDGEPMAPQIDYGLAFTL